MRELTERHTSDRRCSGCHARIDPYGYTLERFDAIGRLREKDLGNRPIHDQATLEGRSRGAKDSTGSKLSAHQSTDKLSFGSSAENFSAILSGEPCSFPMNLCLTRSKPNSRKTAIMWVP